MALLFFNKRFNCIRIQATGSNMRKSNLNVIYEKYLAAVIFPKRLCTCNTCQLLGPLAFSTNSRIDEYISILLIKIHVVKVQEEEEKSVIENRVIQLGI